MKDNKRDEQRKHYTKNMKIDKKREQRKRNLTESKAGKVEKDACVIRRRVNTRRTNKTEEMIELGDTEACDTKRRELWCL